ncbi:eukaryotic aspartyl protease [Necator americanus]|uniref:Eukaryotic aspartyl protease n=1 Tax=Necator americanus TaxID=51031 RepID=W2TCD6_NECAM|nr:eukaryotic aspartyl protease [Necator americanus]ETN79503.1 eukaryotic aspartyl protease [Necator americanus]
MYHFNDDIKNEPRNLDIRLCKIVLCKDKRKFLPDKSETFTSVKEHWEAPGYGGGATGGVLGTDELRLGGENEDQLVIKKASFGLASQADSIYDQIDGVSLGKFKHEGREDVLLHFGNSIAGPSDIVEQIAEAAGAVPLFGIDFFFLPCDIPIPNLEIKSGSTVYVIESKKLIVQIDKDVCILALVGADDGPVFGTTWWVGAPLMRQYCTVFDIGEKKIGFAEQIPEGSKSSTTNFVRDAGREHTVRFREQRFPTFSSFSSVRRLWCKQQLLEAAAATTATAAAACSRTLLSSFSHFYPSFCTAT